VLDLGVGSWMGMREALRWGGVGKGMVGGSLFVRIFGVERGVGSV
jgi:hypothetical protein